MPSLEFKITLKERIKQFLCKHDYKYVARTDNFREPSFHVTNYEEADFYRCEECLHLRIAKG